MDLNTILILSIGGGIGIFGSLIVVGFIFLCCKCCKKKKFNPEKVTVNSLKIEKEQKRSSLWITFDGDKSEWNPDTVQAKRNVTLITNPYVNEITLRRQKPPLKCC